MKYKSLILLTIMVFMLLITIRYSLAYDYDNFTLAIQGRVSDLLNNSLSPSTTVRIIINDSTNTELVNDIGTVEFYFGDNSGFDRLLDIIGKNLTYNREYYLNVIVSGDTIIYEAFKSPKGLITGDSIMDGTITQDDVNVDFFTNVTFTNVVFNTATGDLTPSANITYNLGNQTNWWNNIWVKIVNTYNLVISNSITLDGDTITSWDDIQQNNTLGNIVGVTSSSYDGNLSNSSHVGYIRANLLCAGEFTGSHFCMNSEILNAIANGNTTLTGTQWIQNGPPGYIANSDDCAGWTTNSNTYLGPFWNWDGNSGAGYGRLTNCAQTKQLLCCG